MQELEALRSFEAQNGFLNQGFIPFKKQLREFKYLKGHTRFGVLIRLFSHKAKEESQSWRYFGDGIWIYLGLFDCCKVETKWI